jgi:hypothetical protein
MFPNSILVCLPFTMQYLNYSYQRWVCTLLLWLWTDLVITYGQFNIGRYDEGLASKILTWLGLRSCFCSYHENNVSQVSSSCSGNETCNLSVLNSLFCY